MRHLRKKLLTYDAPRNMAFAVAGGVYIVCALTGYWHPFGGLLLLCGLVSCVFSILMWHYGAHSVVARRMERGEYLVRWQYSYIDRAEAQRLTSKATDWEAIPTPMFFATVGFFASAPLLTFACRKYSLDWLPSVFIAAGAVALAILWALLKSRPVPDPNIIVEQAVIGLEHMYWRKRIVTLCPNNEANPMQLRRVENRIFFVAVSKQHSSEGVTYHRYWIPVPRGEERNARKVMRAVRRHAATKAEQESDPNERGAAASSRSNAVPS